MDNRRMKDSGVEWIGEIPEGWETKRNKYIFRNKKRIVGERSKNYKLLSLTKNKGIIYKDINNNEGKLPASFDTYQEVTKGDLVLCLFDLDISAVFSDVSQYDGMISPAYSVFDISKNCVARFYKYWFKMVGDDRKYKVYSKSLRNTIDINNFNNIFSVIPPRQEQQEIANFLDSKVYLIDDIIEKTKQSIGDYKKYKQSLITETVTKGLNPDVEMKDSGIEWIGEIPKEWSIRKIKHIFFINKKIAGKEGYDILSVTQTGLKIKDISHNEGQMAADYSKYQLVNKGDFVMNHMDLLTGGVDCSAYFGVTSPDYRVFRLIDKSEHVPLYYKYIFQLCYNNKIFYGFGQGVSNLGRWRLQTDTFLNFMLPIPPKHEQKQIADYLDNKCSQINKIIEQKEQLIKELETYKKSLIYEYVTGKKRVEMQE